MSRQERPNCVQTSGKDKPKKMLPVNEAVFVIYPFSFQHYFKQQLASISPSSSL